MPQTNPPDMIEIKNILSPQHDALWGIISSFLPIPRSQHLI